MKTWSNRTVLWLFLCIIFIYLVDLFTIKPSVTSGNGNVGLLFLIPALIVFFLFARSFWRILGSIQLKSSTLVLIRFGGIILLLLFCFLEYNFTINLINNLGGAPGNESSRIYRYPWLNQYTNTVFINFYTLGLMVTGVIFIKSFGRKQN
ncbi:hypothetical protein [Robertmurraya sp. P23]|uniref:hypothetical protein n=1 Tax=Robertmurraya sp. P23 TaxID=3436931 RepID=UPI003D9931F3